MARKNAIKLFVLKQGCIQIFWGTTSFQKAIGFLPYSYFDWPWEGILRLSIIILWVVKYLTLLPLLHSIWTSSFSEESFAVLVQTGGNASKCTINKLLHQHKSIKLFPTKIIMLISNFPWLIIMFFTKWSPFRFFIYLGVTERKQLQNCLFCIEKKRII